MIDHELSAGVDGCEADHEGVGERPGLAAEIADIFDPNTYLLENFSFHRLFQGFSRFHKASQDAVNSRGKVAGSSHEQLAAALYQDDNRRRQAGKMEQTALGTFFGPLGFPAPEGNSATPAKSMSPVPVYDLHSPAGKPEEVLIHAPVYLTQTFKSHPFWRHGPFGKVHCITEMSVELAQVVLGYSRDSQFYKIH